MYLIVGAGGFLGSYLIERLQQRNEKIIATVRDASLMPQADNVEWFSLDVTNENELNGLKSRLEGESVCVFYLAACHNIDFVFENPEKAYSVNVTALDRFLDSGINIDKLFFASTDCVYGENTKEIPCFKETDEGVPVNIYGEQKALAEKLVLSRGFTAARFPFMVGESKAFGKKHFYDNICNSVRSGRCVEMVDGLLRSALSYRQAADLLVRLSDLPQNIDKVNICSDRGYSKYEVGCLVAEENGLDKSFIKKLSEEEGEKFFKDKRASSSLMDNTRLKALLDESEIYLRFG